MMKSLFTLCTVVYSASLFSMHNANTPKPQWTIIRPGEKSKQVTDEAKINEMTAIFNLMHASSQLKKVCLQTISKDEYHCKKIAALLFCAHKNQTGAHKSFCQHADIRDLKDNWKATYHIAHLAEDQKLSPQQTTREIAWFLESLKNAS